MGNKRRIDVMLSSTFFDLEDKRKQVLGLMRRHDLYDIAMENDAALSTMDKIDSSMFKVNRASAYICIIGYRYGTREVCKRRNPDNLSLTELEFRHAQERGIPRCTLIMSGRYRGVPLSEYEAVSAEDRASLAKFRKLAESDRVFASFDEDADFTIKAMQSLDQLRVDLDAQENVTVTALTTSSQLPPSPDDNLPTAPPAFHYVRKPYVEKQGFAGRTRELKLIDQWATSSDAMLLFQAIGGMGKSMLTWHWLKNRADAARSDWAGQFWYSFYEQGADLNDFCVHALAYIRHQPPKTFRGRRTLDLGDELRRELDARPWLLVLDGLERVLAAYNRTGKAHMSDEDAVVVRDDMGLDREPRDCFRPEDDDVLAMLAQSARGKLLATSRLTPTALMNTMTQSIPGMTREPLEGLSPEDAEQVLRNAGIRGNGWRMRHFLEDKFACHPLSVSVVAGQVATFQEARYDFDSWVEHSNGGGDPALIAKDLRGRQNHILSRAFDDLDDDAKALLGSIAMANIELTADVLRLLNPMRPIEPIKVDPPRQLTDEVAESPYSFVHLNLMAVRDRATVADARTTAQADLNSFREQDIAEQTEKYSAYLAAYPAWQQDAGEADAWLIKVVPQLEARGLVQHDPNTNSLDMHPAIRHTALIGLSPQARSSTGSHVSDALSSRPVKPFNEARTRHDLAIAMTRVEALSAAGKFAEGWNLMQSSGLDDALFRLGYDYERLELVQPYFPQGWERIPSKLPEDQISIALHTVGTSLIRIGQFQTGSAVTIESIKLRIQMDDGSIALEMLNLASSLESQGQYFRAARLYPLAGRLASADDDADQMLRVKVIMASNSFRSGQVADTEPILRELRDVLGMQKIFPTREMQILNFDFQFMMLTGSMTEPLAKRFLQRIQTLGYRFSERECLANIALWRQEAGNHLAALDSFGDLIALANDMGSPQLPAYEARRALSLAALGRPEEAGRIAKNVDRGKNAPHVALASLYLKLGDHVKARDHALTGYAEAWGEGPPYHDHWDLEDCRRVLATVGEPEPVLPPFDPSKVEPFDFEPDVERLIEKKLAKKSTAKLSTKQRP